MGKLEKRLKRFECWGEVSGEADLGREVPAPVVAERAARASGAGEDVPKPARGLEGSGGYPVASSMLPALRRGYC